MISADEQPSVAPRSAAESACVMTEYVLPSHANVFGTVFGGAIMSWVDLCGAVAATRHARRAVVTAHVDDLSFQAPVLVGQVVRLHARVNATFRTSMEVEVVVHGEDLLTGTTWPCVRAFMTFVALDDSRKATPVTPLLLDDDDARRRQREAAERRARRLARLGVEGAR